MHRLIARFLMAMSTAKIFNFYIIESVPFASDQPLPCLHIPELYEDALFAYPFHRLIHVTRSFLVQAVFKHLLDLTSLPAHLVITNTSAEPVNVSGHACQYELSVKVDLGGTLLPRFQRSSHHYHGSMTGLCRAHDSRSILSICCPGSMTSIKAYEPPYIELGSVATLLMQSSRDDER